MVFQVFLLVVQVVLLLLLGYFVWRSVTLQQQQRQLLQRDGKKELERVKALRRIRLTPPLVERTRPTSLDDVVGQADGVRALRAALCGPNPQHVIIYGPPGVGKTAAARLVLDEARRRPESPFAHDAAFVEVDATIVRFDERGIADPLLGSIHDPIYQGAGSLGVAGIPQPKPGAVTKAHGGVLFLDEIGELHPHQMNKLLKVLEDRKVHLESAYYHVEQKHIPDHIHDLFQNGLPADFRLVGATTRSPEEIPPALRSRCIEIFFQPLSRPDVLKIAGHALQKMGNRYDEQVAHAIARYAVNGRDANHLVQMVAGVSHLERRDCLTTDLVEWVAASSRLLPMETKWLTADKAVGKVCGLAVNGQHRGLLLDLEAIATPSRQKGTGKRTLTGIIEEEQIGDRQRTWRRKSMVSNSLENVLTVLRGMGFAVDDYDLHLNFSGSTPIDGPSAGVTMAVAIASAMLRMPVRANVAMTGELGLHGAILPVGGIGAKLRAAFEAGASAVFIPQANAAHIPPDAPPAQVFPLDSLPQLFSHIWGLQADTIKQIS